MIFFISHLFSPGGRAGGSHMLRYLPAIASRSGEAGGLRTRSSILLGYDLTVPELSNPLHLSAEIVYRDGLGGPTKDHDWSHATFGIATNFKLNDRLSFVPGLYYQESMDDSVCKRDVIYCKLSLKYRF